MDPRELPDEELWLQMQDDLYDGERDAVCDAVRVALDRGHDPSTVLAEGLVAGMDIVGADFRDGVLFVPEVLLAANAMKAGMEILRPLLVETGAARIGTLVIGTVKGDIHDIGKNLVAMMMEGAGFEVINLGINNDAERFLGAVRQHRPDIIGMSALLTTTMPYMKVVIQALIDEGLRDQVFVMVGGAPVTESFASQVGADAYGRDAATAVELARGHMRQKLAS
jgi:5-methyltetrahydrofolate--homocysteine methyltransferase